MVENYLLNNFVFPRKVGTPPKNFPQENYDGSFIRLFSRGLSKFQELKFLNIIPDENCDQLVSIFERWPKYQNSKIDFESLAFAVRQGIHSPGDYLPVICTSKNALLCLRVPKAEGEMDKFLVNATQIQLPSNVFYGTGHETSYPLRTMPDGPTFKVSRAKVCSDPVIEKIMELSRFELWGGCNSSNFVQGDKDTFGVADPSYVTNWLMAHLAAANEPVTEKVFEVKIRDRAIVDAESENANLWRRSSEFFCAKFVLRHYLTWHLGAGNGIIAYKSIMIVLLIQLCRENSDFDIEMAIQLAAKIARRMKKLDELVKSGGSFSVTDEAQAEIDVIFEIGAKSVSGLRSLVDQKWQTVQDLDADSKFANFDSFFAELEDTTIEAQTNLSLNALESFIEKIHFSLSSKQGQRSKLFNAVLLSQKISREKNERSLPRVPSTTNHAAGLDFTTIQSLYDTERWVMHNCRYRAEQILPSMEDMLSGLKNYHSVASKVYEGNPELYSRMILTCYAFLVIIDKMAIHMTDMIAQHGLDVNVEILNHLLLPLQDQLQQLRYVERYLSKRFNGSSPVVILGDPTNERSLDVRYAKHNDSMKSVRSEILKNAEKMKQLKLEEVRREFQRYCDLKSQASRKSCEFYDKKCYRWDGESYYRSVHDSRCSKCALEQQANNISVGCYRWPLPPSTEGEYAVVFELHCPKDVRILRNAVHFIKTKLSDSKEKGTINNSRNQSLWSEYRSISQHKVGHYPLFACDQVVLMSSSEFNYNPNSKHPSYSPTGSEFILPNRNDLHLGFADRSKKTLISSCSEYLNDEQYLEQLRAMCLMKTNGIHKVLQWTIDSNSHTDSQVICRQHECPKSLSLREFRTFGCMRAGSRLQLRNLVAAIKTDALSWQNEDVVALICQVLWETGTKLGLNNESSMSLQEPYGIDDYDDDYDDTESDNDDESAGCCRDQHQDLMNEVFIEDVLKILELKLESIQDNWDKNLALLCLVLFGCRLLEFCKEHQKQSIAQFLFRCRSVGILWTQKVKEKIDALKITDKNERNLQEKLILIGLTLAATYDVSNENVQWILEQPDQAHVWLTSQNIVSDNLTLSKEKSGTSKLIRNLTQKSWRAGLRIESVLQSILSEDQGLVQRFVCSQYKHVNIMEQTTNSASKWEFVAQCAPWMQLNLPHGSHMCVNTLTGTFLIDNDPVQRLPFEITSHNCYQRLFGSVNLTVAPGEYPGSYVTVREIDGCCYEFQMIDRRCLLITKKTNNGVFYYLPETILQNELPFELGQYSHWLLKCDHTNNDARIEFHMAQVFERRPNNYQGYEIKFVNQQWVLTRDRDRATMLHLKSEIAQKLKTEIFGRIEKDQHTHIFLLPDCSDISVDLPRHRLSFVAKKRFGVCSVEFPGFRISCSHFVGTLVGLKSGIVLESESFKKLIIPHGDLIEMLEDNHVGIRISFDYFHSPSLFVYTVDDNLRQLSPPSNQIANLYLALLHVKTSCPLEDPLTKLTGFEMALQILKRGRSISCKPLDERADSILKSLEKCCPARSLYNSKQGRIVEFENYPNVPRYSLCTLESLFLSCKIVREQSQRLKFMFPNKEKQASNERSFYVENPAATGREKSEPLLQKAALFRLTNTVNSINLETKSLPEPSFYNYDAELMLKSNGILHNCRFVSAVQDFDVAELYYNPSHSLTEWAKTQTKLLGFQHSKLIGDRGLDIWKKIAVKYECLLDLYDIARRGDETRDWLYTLMSFWAYENTLDCRYMIPFFVISKHFRKFEAIDPPRYPAYSDFPEDDVTRSNVVSIVDNCMQREYYYVDNWLRKHSWYCYEHPELFAYQREKEKAEQRFRELYADEKERAVSSSWRQRRSSSCTLSGSFELLDQTEAERRLSSLFYTRYSNRDLLLFLETIDKMVHDICFSAAGQKTINIGSFQSDQSKVFTVVHGIDLSQKYELDTVPDKFDELILPFISNSQSSEKIAHNTDGRYDDEDTSLVELIEGVDLVDPVCEDFKKRLQISWNAYQSGKLKTELKNVSSEDEIQIKLKIATANASEIQRTLMKILVPGEKHHVMHALYKSGILLREAPLALVPQLLDLSSNAQNDWRLLLGALVVRWTEKQRLLRCLQHLKNNKIVHLEREWNNEGHTNWVPRDHVEWLMLEAEGNFLIRPVQVEIALQMFKPPEGVKNAVMQLNMGEGKSSVIVPMLVATISHRYRLCPQVVVLSSLYPLNCNDLSAKMGGILDMRLLQLPFCRDLQLSSDQVKKLTTELLIAKNNRGFIVATPEQLMSMQLKTTETYINDSSSQITSHHFLTETYKNNVRSILDESDDILSVKRQLVYTMGSQVALEGSNQRWKVLQNVLKSLNDHASEIAAKCGPYNVLHDPKTEKNQHQFNLFRLLTKDEESFKVLSEKVVDDFIECRTDADLKPLTPVQKTHAREFVLCGELEFYQCENLAAVLGEDEIPHCLYILRGFFGLKILQHCLTLRHRVNYGIGKHRKMAVPFRAKDVAADKTDFGHPDVALALTQLTYYYQGVSKQGFEEVLRKLSDMQASVSTSIYDKWISICESLYVPKELRSFSCVNMSDQVQIDTLYALFNKHSMVVDYWLENFVYPLEARQFPQKLSANGWDLCREDKNSVTGFSGTNETQLLLPLTIEQCDLPVLQVTNALVINNMLKEENQFYHSVEHGATGYDILNMILDINRNSEQKDQIKVILDPGALILVSNEKLVSRWLSDVPETEISAGIYFDDKDNLMVLDRRGFVTAFHLSPFAGKLGSCVVYLDDVHTRGTDIQFPSGTRAAVTLGKGLSKDKLSQACMRMRLLGCGHSLSFFASSEVDNEIQSLSTSSRVSPVGKVIAWAFQNSQKQVRDGIVHWTNQATDQLYKLCCYKATTSDGKNIIKSLTRFGQEVVQNEVTLLSQLYGKYRIKQTLPDLVENRINIPKYEELNEFKVKLIEKCKNLAHDKKVFADLFDEEQERELEHEEEEEELVVRPGPMTPKTPEVPGCVRRLVHGENVSWNEFVNLEECLKGTKVWNKISSAFKHVFASPEFPLVTCEAIELFFGSMTCDQSRDICSGWINSQNVNRGSFPRHVKNVRPLDDFLRDPFWMICLESFGAMVLLTPFEVNSLFDQLLKMNHATLYMFQPHFQMPSEEIGALHELSGLSIPHGHSLCFHDMVQFSELNLFSGNLYFDGLEGEKWMCQYLGLLPLPRTEEQQQAFECNLIDSHGFVRPNNRCQVPGTEDWRCPFETNPVAAALDLINIRNVDTLYQSSHMYRLLSRCHSNFK